MKILISGSSGLIGSHMTSFLGSQGHEVVPLVRKKGVLSSVYWNPARGEVNLADFENFDAIIHLAGKNLASNIWTKKFKKLLFQSRCRDTWLLSQAILRLKNPPKTLICASAMGIYQKGFLGDLCKNWEHASKGVEDSGIRVAHTRFGIVMSPKGGVLARLIPLFKMGLGAVLGSGKQKIPWIAIDDVIGGIAHILQHEGAHGPYDFVAPQTLTMQEFSQILARHVHRPLFLRIPEWFLKLFGGEMAREMILTSIDKSPDKLLSEGYIFRFPHLEDYLRASQPFS